MPEIVATRLAEPEARSLTDEVKADAQALWEKCLRLYEGEAHLALGYGSWGAYWEAEFGRSDADAYRLLQAARVVRQLPIGSSLNEAQARELVPLAEDEAEVVAAFQDAKAQAEEAGGTLTAQVVRNAVQKRVARIEREAKPSPSTAEPLKADDLEILHGDFRDVLDDLTGQVDAIVTDPPYPAEFIEEFDALGGLATRLLKPTGLLAAMVGQTHLPAYIDRLSRHLDYRWCGAYLTEGPATRIHGRKVGTKWKPILIFGGKRFITQDVFRSEADDKEHHDWGQSESGMADLIERLTDPGDLVVDPFLGAGTTAVVCKSLGRRFVGCDIDPAAVEKARGRL